MKRILTIIILVVVALTAGGYHGSSARAASQTCSNSFPADGHIGPWHTTSGGGTLHGNTVKISCPTQSTAWNVNYGVQFRSNGVWSFYTFDHVTGHGDYQFSESLNPSPCGDSVYAFPMRTHVGNNVTGGNINKPGNDSGVINLCG